ncbi:MAG: hypothetical protein IJ105_05655 [Bacilli bacterium]|nr:hypothetical protein [Bacilli bacterium]
MKKILIPMMVLLLSACSLGMSATPKQKVSEFLDKYKNQDNTILSQLDETIKTEYTNDDYRQRYKTLMTNQYKNMEYKIKDEIIEDNNAVVEAEITVFDYASAIRNANDYLNNNPNEFSTSNPTIDMDDADDETTKDSEDDKLDSTDNKDYDEDKFIDYKLSQMENVNDTVTYTIEFTLTKVDGVWKLDSLSNADIEKLHGIYNQG